MALRVFAAAGIPPGVAAGLLLLAGLIGASGGHASPQALLPAELVAPPAPFTEGPVPWDLPEVGERVVLHARMAHATTGDPNVLFALRDDAGVLVMYAVVDGGLLHVTDGLEADGVTLRPLVQTNAIVTDLWFRVDVVLAHDMYALAFNGIPAATARTFFDATSARLADPADLPHGPGYDPERVRVAFTHYLPADAATSTFNAPLAETGWSPHITGHGHVAAEPGAAGMMSDGRLAVRAHLDPFLPGNAHFAVPALAYAYQPVPVHAGALLLEAWAAPPAVGLSHPHGIPDHMAVWAGLAGPVDDPTVRWAVVMAQVGLEHDRWAFWLIGPDGSRTQVSPTWTALDPYWHRVALLVNETDGTLTVQTDGAPIAQTFSFAGLAAPDHIATGDVWLDHSYWTGAGTAFFDDVVLMRSATGPHTG